MGTYRASSARPYNAAAVRGDPKPTQHRFTHPKSIKKPRGSSIEIAIKRRQRIDQVKRLRSGRSQALTKNGETLWHDHLKTAGREPGTTQKDFDHAIKGLLASKMNHGYGTRRPQFECKDSDASGNDDSSSDSTRRHGGHSGQAKGVTAKRRRRRQKTAALRRPTAVDSSDASGDDSTEESSSDTEYVVKSIDEHGSWAECVHYRVTWKGGMQTWEPDTYIADTDVFIAYKRKIELEARRKKVRKASHRVLTDKRPLAPSLTVTLHNVEAVTKQRGEGPFAEYLTTWEGGSQTWEAAGSSASSISRTQAYAEFQARQGKLKQLSGAKRPRNNDKSPTQARGGRRHRACQKKL